MFIPTIWRMKRFADSVPEILRLQQEMNRLFSNAEQNASHDYPTINVWEKDERVVVTAELPGMDPEKIDISVTGNVLTLVGTSNSEALKEGEMYLRQERGPGAFMRNFQLPFQVSSKEVEAKYEKGILSITLPRLKEDLPKKIKINS